MREGHKGKKKIVSLNTEKSGENGEKSGQHFNLAKDVTRSKGLTKVPVEEFSKQDHSVPLDAERAGIIETSSGYEYDFVYENATCTDIWDTNKPPEGNTSMGKNGNSSQGTEQHCNSTTIVQRNQKEKTETTEQKIKTLKALLRKQEKAVNKLRPDAYKNTNNQASVSLEKVNSCFKSSKGNRPPTKRRRGGDLGTNVRRSKRKKVESTEVTAYRDVDILMSRGDLMTKDEFLACVGLIRVAKFN